jgi:hypothetical protein
LTPTATAETAACIIGTRTTTNWTNTCFPDERGISGAKWTFTADGPRTEQFDGSSPLVNVGGSKTVTYTGTATGTWTCSGNSMSVTYAESAGSMATVTLTHSSN